MFYKKILNNQQESIELAHNIAKNLLAGDILTFTGDLGSGKTFLCREIIKYCCGQDTNVISPTFNLLQTYKADNFTIYHFDLYRLKSLSETYELGIEEALQNNICLIEWPKIIEHILPNSTIKFNLQIIGNGKILCDITKG